MVTGVSSGLDMLDRRRARLGVFRHALSRSDIVAVLSVAVGGVHLVVAPEHFAAWWPAGTFFIVVGASQIALGVVLLRREDVATASMAGLMLNVAVVAVYVASRTTGLGSINGHDQEGYASAAERAETVGALDLTTTIVELVIVAMLLTQLPARSRSIAVDALLLIGLAMWVARLAGFLD